jgi:transposase-like protein
MSDVIQVAALTPIQRQALAALVQGATVTAAAETCGIHRTTIHHWCRTNQAFQAALDEAKAVHAEQLRDDIRHLASKAIQAVTGILDDPAASPYVRLRAALTIIDRATAIDQPAFDHEPAVTRALVRHSRNVLPPNTIHHNSSLFPASAGAAPSTRQLDTPRPLAAPILEV